jgi:streptogramin lyase
MTGTKPIDITTGPDGALWFTECNDSGSGPLQGHAVVGRIDPNSHAITEYSTGESAAGPWGISAGPDGAIWYTEWSAYNVVRIAIQSSSTAPRHAKSTMREALLGRLRLKP